MSKPLNLSSKPHGQRPWQHTLRAAAVCCALVLTSLSLLGATPAQAQSDASAALSLMPLASVVGTASVGSAASTAVAVLPVALSISGAVLTVTLVQASAVGTVYVLERASDGAQASVQVLGSSAKASAYGVGTVVSCSVIGTGVVLSVAGEVLAFIPNAIGQALLHNERL